MDMVIRGTIKLAVLVTCGMILFPASESISDHELTDFSRRFSQVSSLLETAALHSEDSSLSQKRATCFPLSLTFEGKKLSWYFISNHHPFVFKDSLGNTFAEVDSGKVLRNAKCLTTDRDTVITIRVKVIRKHPSLDIVVFKPLEEFPPDFSIEKSGIEIDLQKETPQPQIGDRILYCGFPLLLGQDTTLRSNVPLVIEGFVSQVVPYTNSFIVQAPIFSGASGSPILSQGNSGFLGIVYGKVPNQESLLYAVKANIVMDWMKLVVLEDLLKRARK